MLSFGNRMLILATILLALFAISSVVVNILMTRNVYYASEQHNTLFLNMTLVDACYYMQWIWVAVLFCLSIVSIFVASRFFKWFKTLPRQHQYMLDLQRNL